MSTTPITPRQYRKAMAFEQCPSCAYDVATGVGERSCNYGACPYLPEALDVTCPVCNFNFQLRDTVPACGEPPHCDFARETVGPRLRVLREWMEARR
jgi:hypothetical protein